MYSDSDRRSKHQVISEPPDDHCNHIIKLFIYDKQIYIDGSLDFGMDEILCK